MNRVVAPGSLSGSFRAPASKSHAHRLLICAALGTTPVTVSCDTFSDDILATIDCLTAMGAQITHEESRISVTPVFASRKPDGLCKLPCRESGSTLRFLLPVLGALGLSGVFQMEGRLPERPLHPLDEGLMAHGMVLRRDGSALAELVDFEKELARIAKEKENCLKQIAMFESKLSNEAFVSRAPEKVVSDQKEKLAKNQALLAQLIESEKRLKK